ncbi:hypothetical protein XPA_006420 [Xanthoria parietina]
MVWWRMAMQRSDMRSSIPLAHEASAQHQAAQRTRYPCRPAAHFLTVDSHLQATQPPRSNCRLGISTVQLCAQRTKPLAGAKEMPLCPRVLPYVAAKAASFYIYMSF